ncbi:hypothetical protein ACX80W_00025 [Arthrobacter sp. TMN-37]
MLKRILWALAPIVVSKVMQKRGADSARRPNPAGRTNKTGYRKNFGR